MATAHGQYVLWPSQLVRTGLCTVCVWIHNTLVGNYIFSTSVTSHPDPPVIEAEVRYAVKHEYAQTAVDVIARRCRLSFLNVQSALNALPRVVEIMAEDLHWTYAQQKNEIENATKFLTSMGLPPGVAPPSVMNDNRGFVERIARSLGLSWGVTRKLRAGSDMVYSRAQFETGEIEALKQAFSSKAKVVPGAGDIEQLSLSDLMELVKGLPGYQAVSGKDYDYVLTETGFSQQKDFDFDDFVEVGLFLCTVDSFRFTDIFLGRFVRS